MSQEKKRVDKDLYYYTIKLKSIEKRADEAMFKMQMATNDHEIPTCSCGFLSVLARLFGMNRRNEGNASFTLTEDEEKTFNMMMPLRSPPHGFELGDKARLSADPNSTFLRNRKYGTITGSLTKIKSGEMINTLEVVLPTTKLFQSVFEAHHDIQAVILDELYATRVFVYSEHVRMILITQLFEGRLLASVWYRKLMSDLSLIADELGAHGDQWLQIHWRRVMKGRKHLKKLMLQTFKGDDSMEGVVRGEVFSEKYVPGVGKIPTHETSTFLIGRQYFLRTVSNLYHIETHISLEQDPEIDRYYRREDKSQIVGNLHNKWIEFVEELKAARPISTPVEVKKFKKRFVRKKHVEINEKTVHDENENVSKNKRDEITDVENLGKKEELGEIDSDENTDAETLDEKEEIIENERNENADVETVGEKEAGLSENKSDEDTDVENSNENKDEEVSDDDEDTLVPEESKSNNNESNKKELYVGKVPIAPQTPQHFPELEADQCSVPYISPEELKNPTVKKPRPLVPFPEYDFTKKYDSSVETTRPRCMNPECKDGACGAYVDCANYKGYYYENLPLKERKKDVDLESHFIIKKIEPKIVPDEEIITENLEAEQPSA